jgi:hypothetical protein
MAFRPPFMLTRAPTPIFRPAIAFRPLLPTGLQITGVQFPASLSPGQPITGTVTVQNPATEAQDIKVVITPQWVAKTFTATKTAVPAGESATFTFPVDFTDETGAPAALAMPNQDATLKIDAYVPATATSPTDTATVTIKLYWLYSTIGPLTVWQWLLVGGGLLLLYAISKRK